MTQVPPIHRKYKAQAIAVAEAIDKAIREDRLKAEWVAATLGIDACPMEGFDPRVLDEELGLRARGLSSVALVSLGYRSADDFNAKLPKSRLPAETVLSEI